MFASFSEVSPGLYFLVALTLWFSSIFNASTLAVGNEKITSNSNILEKELLPKPSKKEGELPSVSKVKWLLSHALTDFDTWKSGLIPLSRPEMLVEKLAKDWTTPPVIILARKPKSSAIKPEVKAESEKFTPTADSKKPSLVPVKDDDQVNVLKTHPATDNILKQNITKPTNTIEKDTTITPIIPVVPPGTKLKKPIEAPVPVVIPPKTPKITPPEKTIPETPPVETVPSPNGSTNGAPKVMPPEKEIPENPPVETVPSPNGSTNGAPKVMPPEKEIPETPPVETVPSPNGSTNGAPKVMPPEKEIPVTPPVETVPSSNGSTNDAANLIPDTLTPPAVSRPNEKTPSENPVPLDPPPTDPPASEPTSPVVKPEETPSNENPTLSVTPPVENKPTVPEAVPEIPPANAPPALTNDVPPKDINSAIEPPVVPLATTGDARKPPPENKPTDTPPVVPAKDGHEDGKPLPAATLPKEPPKVLSDDAPLPNIVSHFLMIAEQSSASPKESAAKEEKKKVSVPRIELKPPKIEQQTAVGKPVRGVTTQSSGSTSELMGNEEKPQEVAKDESAISKPVFIASLVTPFAAVVVFLLALVGYRRYNS